MRRMSFFFILIKFFKCLCESLSIDRPSVFFFRRRMMRAKCSNVFFTIVYPFWCSRSTSRSIDLYARFNSNGNNNLIMSIRFVWCLEDFRQKKNKLKENSIFSFDPTRKQRCHLDLKRSEQSRKHHTSSPVRTVLPDFQTGFIRITHFVNTRSCNICIFRIFPPAWSGTEKKQMNSCLPVANIRNSFWPFEQCPIENHFRQMVMVVFMLNRWVGRAMSSILKSP